MHTGQVSPDRPAAVRAERLYVQGCPGWTEVAAALDRLAGELGFTWTRVLVESDAMAASLGFHGSPSVHIDGADPFADPDAPVGLTCRLHPTADGARPSRNPQLLAAVLRAAVPPGQ